MKKNANVVGDYACDQFYHVKFCTERDADCAEYLQISCRPCLRLPANSHADDIKI